MGGRDEPGHDVVEEALPPAIMLGKRRRLG